MFWAGRKKGARGELVTLRDPGVWAPALASLRPRSPGLLLPPSPGPWNLGLQCPFSQTRSKGLQPSPPSTQKSRPPDIQFMAHLWRVSLSPARGLSPISYYVPPPLGAWAGGNFPRRQSRGSQQGRVAGPGAGPSAPRPRPPPQGWPPAS